MSRAFTSLFVLTAACAFAEPNAADVMFAPLPELEHPIGLDVLFSPTDNIEARIIKQIAGAKREVLVNHYLITSQPVREALIKKFREGKVVIAVLDANPSVRDYEGIKKLREAKVPVVSVSRGSGHWNNSKYIIIDRDLVLVGTGDLSNAAKRNDEVLLSIAEPSVVISFYNNFIKTARSTTSKD